MLSLREVQRKKLADFSPTWHNDITTLPQKPSLIVANEYFDALPIRQFAKLKANKWREVLVGSNDTSELGYIMSEEIDPLQIVALGASSSSLETHDFVEVSPATSAQATLLADHLKSAGGSALFIDYGYQQAEGYNSLQAVKDHQKHDPLYEVGTADLTAHVDFEQLTRCFSQRGMNTFGPVAQGAFLSALGLEARLNNLVQNASPSEERELRSGAERLVASETNG